MFVWIPRYAYKITNQTVDIEFLYGNTNYYLEETKVVETNEDGTEKIDYIPEIKDIIQKEGYKVHPSFTNGTNTNYTNGEWNEEINGFWVAKYVAGFQDSTITHKANGEEIYPTSQNIIYSEEAYTSYNNSNTHNALGQDLSSNSYATQRISYPVFKPLTYSYNLISTGDCYTISQKIAETSGFYGLNSNQTQSHMMKNSEWGAVVYLTQSKYGRNGVEVTQNTKNLNNKDNKNIYAVTGYAGNIANGVSASSTNNMSGIFDLNGCVWEFVTGYISNGNDSLLKYGNSYVSVEGADEEAYKTKSTKDVTIYPYDSLLDNANNNWNRYNQLKTAEYGYGDAILETSTMGEGYTSWNNNHSEFPYQERTFLARGGSFGSVSTNGGIFAFYPTNGACNEYAGFRAVLIGK